MADPLGVRGIELIRRNSTIGKLALDATKESTKFAYERAQSGGAACLVAVVRLAQAGILISSLQGGAAIYLVYSRETVGRPNPAVMAELERTRRTIR